MLYILKIGGSVATQKNRKNLVLRKTLLKNIAKNIKKWIDKNPDIKLILIHGAGGSGHYLAKKYDLANGILKDAQKHYGAVLSRIANQKLDLKIFSIFAEAGIHAIPVHSGSMIIQKNKKINYLDVDIIKMSFKNNFIPMLYGEMVFDEKLGMSVCSGDASAAFLAKKLKVEKVYFATDVDGVFDKDPHLYKNAKIIKKIKLKDVFSENILLEKSHNQDVTDGLRGKLRTFQNFFANSFLKKIVIFNGKIASNYADVLNNKEKISTHILLK